MGSFEHGDLPFDEHQIGWGTSFSKPDKPGNFKCFPKSFTQSQIEDLK
jgi:hypothetical protein